MHELMLAEEIVATSLQAIDAHDTQHLERVHVVVGRGSHIDPEILSDAFKFAAAGAGAPRAVLSVETSSSLCPLCSGDAQAPNAGVAVTAVELAD